MLGSVDARRHAMGGVTRSSRPSGGDMVLGDLQHGRLPNEPQK